MIDALRSSSKDINTLLNDSLTTTIYDRDTTSNYWKDGNLRNR